MRLLRAFRRKRDRTPAPVKGADVTPGIATEALRAVEESRKQYRADRVNTIDPLRSLIEQNNVHALVKNMMKRQGIDGDPSTTN